MQVQGHEGHCRTVANKLLGDPAGVGGRGHISQATTRDKGGKVSGSKKKKKNPLWQNERIWRIKLVTILT